MIDFLIIEEMRKKPSYLVGIVFRMTAYFVISEKNLFLVEEGALLGHWAG